MLQHDPSHIEDRDTDGRIMLPNQRDRDEEAIFREAQRPTPMREVLGLVPTHSTRMNCETKTGFVLVVLE